MEPSEGGKAAKGGCALLPRSGPRALLPPRGAIMTPPQDLREGPAVGNEGIGYSPRSPFRKPCPAKIGSGPGLRACDPHWTSPRSDARKGEAAGMDKGFPEPGTGN